MNRWVAFGLSLAAALLLAAGALRPAWALDALPAGPGVFNMPLAKVGANDDPMRVFVYRPGRWTDQDRIVIIMHGIERNADHYRDEWQALAEKDNLLLVVPEFSKAKFPGAGPYNFGNVADRKGKPRPRASWTFGVIDKVFAEAKARTGARREHYSLFGHSAGAQFVHRYLIFANATQADVIIAASAGSYTMPTQDADFPWGLNGANVTRADLANAFARNVVIMVGERDVDPNHPTLPRNPRRWRKGRTASRAHRHSSRLRRQPRKRLACPSAGGSRLFPARHMAAGPCRHARRRLLPPSPERGAAASCCENRSALITGGRSPRGSARAGTRRQGRPPAFPDRAPRNSRREW